MKWPKRDFVLALSLALSAGAAGAQERLNTPEYREACAALMCQCGGCSATVYTCAMEHCHSAEPIREEIAEKIQKGESAESIVKVFEERYGLGILSAPPASGFHLTAWIAPFAVLLAGFFFTSRVLRSWKQGTVPQAPAPITSITEAQRARIEKELREISS